jgi:hypothetical protein
MIIEPRMSRWPGSTNSLSTGELHRRLESVSEDVRRAHRRALLADAPTSPEEVLGIATEERRVEHARPGEHDEPDPSVT